MPISEVLNPTPHPAPPREAVRVAIGVNIAVAAAAMVATLPGRTHGLGVITESLIADLRLERVGFAAVNLWATLLGSLFCVPWGWLLDRVGHRIVLTGTLLGLGSVVVAMSRVKADGVSIELLSVDGNRLRTEWLVVPGLLFVLVLLTRGLGQSALSVVSLAVMGKASGRRGGVVVAVYSVLVSVGFMGAFGAVKGVLEAGDGTGWRELWAGIGWLLIAFAVASALALRESVDAASSQSNEIPAHGSTLSKALMTPTFWVFALAISFYGMVSAGVSLFGQSLLAERNFDRSVFLTISTATPLIGLAANLVTGWLAARLPLSRLLAAAMGLLATALLAFPFVSTLPQVYAYAAAMGVAGGMITVLFFAVWARTYGPRHLGRIQGAAQFLTVLASAAGPLLLALMHRSTGAYGPLFQYLAAAAAAFAVVAWFVRVPVPSGDV